MTLVLLLELEMDNLFDLGDSDVVRLENYEELWFMEFFEVLSVFFQFEGYLVWFQGCRKCLVWYFVVLFEELESLKEFYS